MAIFTGAERAIGAIGHRAVAVAFEDPNYEFNDRYASIVFENGQVVGAHVDIPEDVALRKVRAGKFLYLVYPDTPEAEAAVQSTQGLI